MDEQTSEFAVEYRSLSFMGYPNYKVGSDGTIWKNLHYGKLISWRKVEPTLLSDGYLCIELSSRNPPVRKQFKVHRLVLEAFVGLCPKGMETRHFPDRDKTNNRLSNLSWGTRSENYKDKLVHGTDFVGERNPRSVINEEMVRKIRKLKETGLTAKQIAFKMKLSIPCIEAVVSRRNWKHVL